MSMTSQIFLFSNPFVLVILHSASVNLSCLKVSGLCSFESRFAKSPVHSS